MAQEVIPLKEHTESDWIIDLEPTTEVEGSKHTECTVCGITLKTEAIEKILVASEGLEFVLNEDGQSYSVIGIGTCTDTNIVIPSTYNGLPVTSIGDGAFCVCLSLTSINIPDSVTSIGEMAFSKCISLTSIEVDENNTKYKSIEGNLYNKDGTVLIQYATGKQDISFEIPDSVTSIGDGAFGGCISLTSINIPDSVTSIGNYAFSYCDSLTSVTIGNSVTSIAESAFFYCISLTSIEVDENNTKYKSIDGDLYNKDGTVLIQYAKGKSNPPFEIPNSVTSIGQYAFYCCFRLTNVIIPDSVTSIGDEAFGGCISLTSINIPDSVMSIGDEAFSDCDSLTSITIPNSVTSIGQYAFSDCDSLTIYCEAEAKPDAWYDDWNSNCSVVWGYKGE